jgi:hypothetical protein
MIKRGRAGITPAQHKNFSKRENVKNKVPVKSGLDLLCEGAAGQGVNLLAG